MFNKFKKLIKIFIYLYLQNENICKAISTGTINQFTLQPSKYKIPNGKPYSGTVNGYNVAGKYVELKMDDESFSHIMELYSDGTPYDIKFHSNRLPYQVQHHALTWFQIHNLFDLLINNPEYDKSYEISLNERNEYAKRENLNNEQSRAVHSITTGTYDIPFLLFGPPGKNTI